MSRKKLVIIIAEGSEQDALYPNLKKFGEKLNIQFKIMGTDVFTAEENNKKSSKAIIGDIIREVTSRPEINKKDIKLVIQLTDTDGVYISNDKIVVDTYQSEKTTYTFESIRVNSQDQLKRIEKRNYKKRMHLNTLAKTEKILSIVTYKILYFSRNLDHVISNKPDTPNLEKSRKADAFSDSFATPNDFEKFFTKSDFTVNGTYDETWDFIKEEAKSLERFSNFHFIFEMLKEIKLENEGFL